MLTGMKISHSAQHRLVHRSSFSTGKAKEPVQAVSANGGKVRLRIPKGRRHGIPSETPRAKLSPGRLPPLMREPNLSVFILFLMIKVY